MLLGSDDAHELQNRAQPAQRDESLLARALQPWWTLAASWVPDGVSANALTLLGTLAVIVPTILLVSLSPALSGPIPRWLIGLEVLGVFAFQTLDAIDGKHARRMKTSSALGSWLDHSLDIFSVEIMLLGLAGTLQIGRGWALWFMLAVVAINSWLLHWETSVTRVLVLGNGTSITEVQGMAIGVHAAGAVMGPELFTTRIFGVSLGTWLVILCVGVVGVAAFLGSVRRVAACADKAATRVIVARALPPFAVVGAVTAVVALTSSGAVVVLASLLGVFVSVAIIADLVLGNLLGRFPAPRHAIARCVVGCALLVFGALAKRDDMTPFVAGVLVGVEGVWLVVKLAAMTRSLARALDVPVFSGRARRSAVRGSA